MRKTTYAYGVRYAYFAELATFLVRNSN